MERAMQDLCDILARIRKHPGAYLGFPSLGRLSCFIAGYEQALDDRGESVDRTLLKGFQDWLRKEMHVSGTQGWESVIRFQSAGEENAYDTFWELLDRYRAETEHR
jgi:hypothetical protein